MWTHIISTFLLTHFFSAHCGWYSISFVFLHGIYSYELSHFNQLYTNIHSNEYSTTTQKKVCKHELNDINYMYNASTFVHIQFIAFGWPFIGKIFICFEWRCMCVFVCWFQRSGVSMLSDWIKWWAGVMRVSSIEKNIFISSSGFALCIST